jgi:hypothetical protein
MIAWFFVCNKPGSYKVNALIKVPEKVKIMINCESKSMQKEVEATGDEFVWINMGNVDISEAGDNTIFLKLMNNSPTGLELKKVELTK